MLCKRELHDLSLGTAYFPGGSDVCELYTRGLPLLKGFHQAKTHGSCSSLTPWGTVTFLPLPPSLRAPSAPPSAPQHAAGPQP